MGWDSNTFLGALSPLANAILVNIFLSIASIGIGTLIGAFIGIASLSKFPPIRMLAIIYLELFLSLPVLILLVWTYYALPTVIPWLNFDALTCALTAMALSLSAFVAQIARAGVSAIEHGQIEVARSCGFSTPQLVRLIIWPQAWRIMLPPLMGQYITTYKFSTLASIITVNEILHRGGDIIASTYRPLEVYSAIAVFFVATVVPLNLLSRKLEASARLGGTTVL